MQHRSFSPSSRAGFSLVEMAVVLSIIGLMVGGIMVGNNMLRNADIQATLAMSERYAGAIQKFHDRYFSLPGDMPNATTLWGAANAAATCTAPTTAIDGDTMSTGTGTQTCSGNGDGRIGGSSITTGASGACSGNVWETYRMWQHLRNAGLIDGSYTGISTNSGTAAAFTTAGTNVPSTSLNGGGYTVVFCGSTSNVGGYFDAAYGHAMLIGRALPFSPFGFTHQALFSANEAGEIDKKLDDSYADTGRILGIQSDAANSPDCTTNASNTPANTDYNYSGSGPLCPLIMKLGF